jgi:hypothetical protein
MTSKEVIKTLRNKVPVEYIREHYFEDSAELPPDLKLPRGDDAGSPERAAKTNSSGRRTRETSHRIPQNLRDHMDDVRGQHLARFLSPDLIVMREINSDETEKAVETIDTTVNGLVVDRSVDQRLLDRLVMKGLEYVAARDFKGIIKRPLNIRLLRIGS